MLKKQKRDQEQPKAAYNGVISIWYDVMRPIIDLYTQPAYIRLGSTAWTTLLRDFWCSSCCSA